MRLSRERRWVLASGAVLAIAAWARLDVWRAVLWHGEVLPQYDSDSAYHLHRILETVRRFPAVPTLDPWMNWPDGAMCPWAHGFDLLAAALGLAAGGGRAPANAALAAALLPVALGVAVVWATMALARRLVGPRNPGAAIAAGLLAAVLPTGVEQSSLGRIDHHVVEALSVALLAIWTLDALPGRAQRRGRPVAFEAQGAVLATLALYLFSGAALYVAIAAAVVLVAILARPGPQRLVGSGAPGLAAAAVASALLAWPAISEHHLLLSFQLPSLLQPALYAVAAAGLALATGVTRWRPASGLGARLAWSAAACVALGAALAIAVPALRREVVSGVAGWLLHDDPWLRQIMEFQPMLRAREGRPAWALLHEQLGWAGFVAVLAVPLAAWRIARRDRAAALAFAAQAAALVGLTFVQTRFARVAVPLVSVAVALAVSAVVELAGARRPRLARLRGPIVAGAVALLLLLDPPSRVQLLPVRPRGPDPYQSAALDLRDAPPPRPGALGGVLVGWTWGHWVEALGRRPVVVNGFGTYLDAASFWDADRALRGTPAELEAFMRRRDAGYLVYGAVTAAGGEEPPPSFDALRHRPLGPLVIGGSGVPKDGSPHLAHWLPRFASRQITTTVSSPVPALWTYELVAGARLAGEAPPGSRVVAELPFQENHRSHVWRAWADAGADGRYELVVPVPTGWTRPTISTGAVWTVRVDGRAPASLPVPEAAVRAGSTLLVPQPR